MKFTHEEMKVVAKLYYLYKMPMDQLPYTETFELMFADFMRQTNRTMSLRQFYLGCLNFRKSGELGKMKATAVRDKAGPEPEAKKDVHTEHCCKNCGCKYGYDYCPVVKGIKNQSYPCRGDCTEPC